MIKFLIKGLLRDPSRSIFPIIVIILGAFLTCLMEGYMNGAFSSIIDVNTRFSTGHVKVMSKGYAELINQKPNDLALLNVTELEKSLNQQFPNITWVKRIQFAGLLDIPDENRETKEQGPVIGMAVDFFDQSKKSDLAILNIQESLIRGRLPSSPNEMIMGDNLFKKLNLTLGDEATLLTTSADGASVAGNFIVVGTVSFGVQAMDQNMIMTDLAQMQYILNLYDSVGELFGFQKNYVFNDKETVLMEEQFRKQHVPTDEFSPILLSLRNQNMLAEMIDLSTSIMSIVITVFIILVSIVIWNTRLIANLRRYGEIGVRLAIGESKNQLVFAMIIEALVLGLVGGILGTILGAGAVYLLELYGLDISYATKGQSAMMMNDVLRGKLSIATFYVGFIPALIAPLLGTLMATIGIYRRQTATLFKELEV
tara:strand:- start:3310 stop:4587 length:1278 start_codon:yes stop_codon:yes gene_type:complete